jgi:peptidoglycan/LPS O-acetylase OafA/YrhL
LIFTFLPKRIWIFSIISVIAGSVAYRMVYYNDPNVLYFSTFSVLVDLGMGGLAAYAIKSSDKIKRFFESSSTPVHLFLFGFCISLLIWGKSFFPFKYGDAVSRALLSASFAMIIAAQAMTTKNSILNLGNFSFANKWGKYTYGIYMIHPIALTILDILTRITHIPLRNLWSTFAYGLAAFLLTLLLSWLSYEFFESKFLALKDKFTLIKTNH